MKRRLFWVFILALLAPSYRLLVPSGVQGRLIQDFDSETLITSYSERITYDDLAVDTSPTTIFKIHVPRSAIDPEIVRPFMYLT